MSKVGLPVLIVLLLFAAAAQAHPVALGVSVDPVTVNMAGHLSYTITAESPAGWNVIPPRPKAQEGDFDVVKCAEPVITETAGGGHRLALTCDLVVFGSGRVALPALPVKISGPGGEAETDIVPETTVEVIAPLVGDKPRPPKGPETIARNWHKILLVAGGVLLGAALLALAVYLLVRKLRQRPQKAAPLPPPEPPDLRALRRLAAPVLDEMLFAEAAKPYYSELTEIVREYLEGRYQVPALERTTTEILHDIRQIDLRGHENFLRDLLQTADKAKFADLPVPLARWSSDRLTAQRLVEDTRVVAPPPEPVPAAIPIDAKTDDGGKA